MPGAIYFGAPDRRLYLAFPSLASFSFPSLLPALVILPSFGFFCSWVSVAVLVPGLVPVLVLVPDMFIDSFALQYM